MADVLAISRTSLVRHRSIDESKVKRVVRKQCTRPLSAPSPVDANTLMALWVRWDDKKRNSFETSHVMESMQNLLKTSNKETVSIWSADVQKFEHGNANKREREKKISDHSSFEAIANSCHDEKKKVVGTTNVVDDLENYNMWFVRKKTTVVGSDGAVIKVGGCRVSIPEGALGDDVEVTLTSSYQEDFPANRATPLLTCEPHGLKFNKDVEVALPTCYLTDGTFSVKAEARRSEDGKLWETVKTFDYTVERCFKFCIRGFSLYDVITERIHDLVVEKEVVCCIPHRYTHDPQQLALICNIFDAIGEHRKHNCTDVMTTTLPVGNSEPSVSFQLTSEEININQSVREVSFVGSSKIKQARFILSKRDEHMMFKPLKLVITAGETTIEEEFFIFPDSQDQTNVVVENYSNLYIGSEVTQAAN